MSRRPASARPSVTSSAYSRSEPTGRPLASRVTRARRAEAVGEVRRGRLARHRRVRREHDLLDAVALDALEELVDAQRAGIDAVDGRQRAAEHVVEAAVLGRPLDRNAGRRLLDDADDGAVAARVEADPAHLVLGEVAALAAEAHPLLHVLDRLRERQRLVLLRAEQVEGEPLSRTRADAGKARQLRDEVVHGRAEHGPIVQVLPHVLLPLVRNRRAPVGRAGRADGEVADRLVFHGAVHVEDAGGDDHDAVRLDGLPLFARRSR